MIKRNNKTRRDKLVCCVDDELNNAYPNIDSILNCVDVYEKNNLDIIDKCNRVRKIDSNRVSGAIKQTINSHGSITKQLIGSTTKRILGAMLENNTEIKTEKKINGFLIMFSIITLLIFGLLFLKF